MLNIPGHKGNAKSKLHSDSPAILLECLPSRTQATNVGKDVGKKKPSYTDDGDVN
jgi:hypothetical protein